MTLDAVSAPFLSRTTDQRCEDASWLLSTVVLRLFDPTQRLADESLLEILALMDDGETAALGDLYDLLGRPVYWLAYGLTQNHRRAAQATEATFARLWRDVGERPAATTEMRRWVAVTILRTAREQLARPSR